jgi:hypothetical protein
MLTIRPCFNSCVLHSVNKVQDDIEATIGALIRKSVYKKKQDEGRVQDQKNAFESLRRRHLGGATLPNSILDKAVLLTGETSVNESRRNTIEPRGPKVRKDRVARHCQVCFIADLDKNVGIEERGCNDQGPICGSQPNVRLQPVH